MTTSFQTQETYISTALWLFTYSWMAQKHRSQLVGALKWDSTCKYWHFSAGSGLYLMVAPVMD